MRGFTLVELLVVMAVAALLATIAVPSLITTMQANRLDSMSNKFVATLSMARSEAVKQGVAVSVQSVSGTNNWSGGWQVVGAPGQPAAVVQAVPALAQPSTAYGSVASIGFDSTGRLINNGAPANFILCVDGVNASNARGVTVALSGRVRVADTDKITGRPLENDQQTVMQGCTAP